MLFFLFLLIFKDNAAFLFKNLVNEFIKEIFIIKIFFFTSEKKIKKLNFVYPNNFYLQTDSL